MSNFADFQNQNFFVYGKVLTKMLDTNKIFSKQHGTDFIKSKFRHRQETILVDGYLWSTIECSDSHFSFDILRLHVFLIHGIVDEKGGSTHQEGE